MPFQPRLERPSINDPYWLTTGQGGYNKCIPVLNGVMPNCTGYAYGRFMEAGGVTSCKLSTANAGLWYGNTSDGYTRGQTPKLGAVICFDNPGKAGHVAIVEKINSDGSIVLSESGYMSTSYFWTSTQYPPNYYHSPYKFQGFIYNPYVKNTTKVEDFIKEAKSKINKSFSGSFDNKNDCSAAFVVSCAKAVGGLIDVVIPNNIHPSEFAKKGIQDKLGSFVSSARKNAKVGDIILIRDKAKELAKDLFSAAVGSTIGGVAGAAVANNVTDNMTKYSCDDIGIVIEVQDSKVIVVMAESHDNIKKKEYSFSSNACYGFYRPDWSKVDSNPSLVFGYGSLGKFYDTENTEEDATIREVGYLSSDNKPTLSKSNIRLSVVNYTTMMSAIMDDLLVPMMYSSDNVILDGVENQNARIIIDSLIKKGLNAAAAVGICANIKHESGYRPDVIEYGYTFANGGVGICQWTNYPRNAAKGRKTDMVNAVGSDWRTNLTGQIDFLWYELKNNSGLGLSELQTVPNTETGARKAADIFVRKFERPANIDSTSKARQNSASELWGQIVIQTTSVSGGNANDIMNTSPVKGTEVVVPSWVNQSGICASYTNYSYYYGRWASTSVQKRLADKWGAQGKPSNRNIATLDGYYLCATTLTFGTTGDIISIILENDTSINAIIADSKGIDPSKNGESGNEYGHRLGNGKIDVIEWEVIGSTTSRYDVRDIDLTGWKGQKVVKIINGGAYKI